MSKVHNQLGLGTTVVVLIILTIMTVGGIGFYIANKPKPNGAASSQTSSENNSSNSKKPPSSNTNEAVVEYVLSIKEWGVQISLSESIKDAYYTTIGSGTGADGIDNTAWISLTSLNGTSCDVAKTGLNDKNKPLGSILRVLPTDIHPVKGNKYIELYPNGTTINGYYYVYVPSINATCVSSERLQRLNKEFVVAVEKATKN